MRTLIWPDFFDSMGDLRDWWSDCEANGLLRVRPLHPRKPH
jgi:hypothetical protein